MPDSNAIFISYAHEDVEAARKIAEALRGFGLEVWFDANELRGGDQWDANIRRQIKACRLFLPIVSQTTQHREEAYFRLEWKLAHDRTDLMAPGRAFIVPVVIDDTPEYEAEVPESFTKAQFTRLVGGDPTPEFVSQVKSLATGSTATLPKRTPATVAGVGDPGPAVDSSPASPSSTAPKKNLVLPIVAMSIVGILVAMFGVMWMGQRNDEATAPTPDTALADEPALVTPAPADRLSIAVLPFTNMSDDPSSNSFFADGIHEDLLTNLSYIGELKVVSRTSVMQYRDTTKPVKIIGSELGVGTLLEGSVRRAGDQVRVTAQLIDATTDEHIWAQAYDRKLEDIFAIQGELARSITQALKVALTEEQVDILNQRTTEDTAAYELLLQENALADREGNTAGRLAESVGLLQQAVSIDPNFGLAWARLGRLHAQSHFWYFDTSPERLDLATTCIERAIALAPDNLDVKTEIGGYHYYGFRNYAKAAEYYQQVLDVAPHHVDATTSMGFIRRREGRWRESLAWFQRALELDPRNVGLIDGLFQTSQMLRDFEKAEDYAHRMIEAQPGTLYAEAWASWARGQIEDSLEPMREFAARYESVTTDIPWVLWRVRYDLALADQNEAAINRILDQIPKFFSDQERLLARSAAARVLGDNQQAKALAQQAIPELLALKEAKPQDAEVRGRLIRAYCLSKNQVAARHEIDGLRAHLESLDDAFDSHGWRIFEFRWRVLFDTPASAADIMRESLRHPSSDFHPLMKFLAGPSGLFFQTTEGRALFNDREAWAPLIIE